LFHLKFSLYYIALFHRTAISILVNACGHLFGAAIGALIIGVFLLYVHLPGIVKVIIIFLVLGLMALLGDKSE